MRIARIEIKNFLSFRETVLDLPDGLVAITGENRDAPGARSNGAGKSSVVDAIAWCLFGQTTRGISGDDVVRLAAGKDCFVSVIFGNGKWVVRFRKDSICKNTVQIFEGGKRLHFDRVRDAQKQIEKMIGMDWTTFQQSVLFGQSATRFLGLTDRAKKEVIERILGSDVLEKASAEARDRGKTEADLAVKLMNEQQIIKTAIEGMDRECAARMDAIRKRFQTQQEQQKLVQKEIADEKAAILRTQKDSRKSIDDVLSRKARSELILEGARKKLSEKTSYFEGTDKQVREIAELVGRAEDVQRKFRSRSDDLRIRIDQLSKLDQICPTCGQKIDSEALEQIIAGMDEMRKELEGGYKESRAEVRRIRDTLALVVERKTVARNVQQNAARTVEGLEASIKEAAREAAFLKRELENQQKLRSDRLQKLQNRLRSLSSAEEDSELAEVRRIASRATEAGSKLATACLREDRARVNELDFDFWSKGFGLKGLRSMLLDGVLPYLEQRANNYLKSLTGSTFQLSLSPISASADGKLRDSVSVQIASSSGGERYASLSGGEKQRVDVAMALALFDLARSRAGIDFPLVVFDEIFERLDDAGCESVGALLRQNSRRWGTVLLVTHLDGLLQEVPNQIKVVKKGGVSEIAK